MALDSRSASLDAGSQGPPTRMPQAPSGGGGTGGPAFRSPQEAVAALEQAIQQLKAGQLGMDDFVGLLQVVLDAFRSTSAPGGLAAMLSKRPRDSYGRDLRWRHFNLLKK
jgi:hypothetical protein